MLATRFRQILSSYERERDLITVGAYQRGTDPRIDQAIDYHPKMMMFLRQNMHERCSQQESVRQLMELMQGTQELSMPT